MYLNYKWYFQQSVTTPKIALINSVEQQADVSIIEGQLMYKIYKNSQRSKVQTLPFPNDFFNPIMVPTIAIAEGFVHNSFVINWSPSNGV